MRIYRGRTLLDVDADYDIFASRFATAVVDKSDAPFLLVRDDDARLLVVWAEGNIMLCIATGETSGGTTYVSSLVEGRRSFQGLTEERFADETNFIDADDAMKAVRCFFNCGKLGEFVDFRQGVREVDMLRFPGPITQRKRVERHLVDSRVEVTDELRTDMREVCELLDECADDPDENIDYGDAIQIRSLCGGRINRRKEIFSFSYHLDSGDVWRFEVPRTVLDGIADGSIRNLSVTASVPK